MVFTFLGALSLSVLAFEIGSALQGRIRRGRLSGAQVEDGAVSAVSARRSTWEALLIAVWPERFDPQQARSAADVVSLLRRAGYPYDTPGEFYAAAIRDFTIYLAIGGLVAGTLVVLKVPFAAPFIALLFVALGLRKPYTRLKHQARKRAGGMQNNMLIGLSMLNALLASGVGVQEALRRTVGIGGPFCNLLGLLVARMEVEDFTKAIETVRAHLPDPADVEANLFLRDVYDFFVHNRPILSGVQALQEAVHRSVVESTEARAALVRQRSGLFGVLAVVGMILSILAPYVF